MKALITGHRLYKLENYDVKWIQDAIDLALIDAITYGYSGMASGVDLWFCRSCLNQCIPYAACIPFEEQWNTMSEEDRVDREHLISKAARVIKCRNRVMVEKAEMGIVVWDGNKGGTHNVLQQLIEMKKPFVWINPVSQKVYNCL